MAHAMSDGDSLGILARLGQVTANAGENAAHVLCTVSESALPLVQQAASLILDKTAVFSECLGDTLYCLAKASKTVSARRSDCPSARLDGIGLEDPDLHKAVAPAVSSSLERKK
jgi:hypothetical protein